MVVLCILVWNTIFSQSATKQKQQGAPSFSKTDKITYKIIDAPNHTYGYDLYSNGVKTIHQTTIPGMQGIEGFKTKQQAESVANLIIERTKKGSSLPYVSEADLKQLHIIK